MLNGKLLLKVSRQESLMSEKKYGINWVAINEAVGEFTRIHPMAMIADFIHNNPELDEDAQNKIWDAGVALMNCPQFASATLEELTGTKQIIWLHFWSMWESSYGH